LIKTQYQAQIETIEKKYDTIPERYQYVESSLD
jgi:hypothetical protein